MWQVNWYILFEAKMMDHLKPCKCIHTAWPNCWIITRQKLALRVSFTPVLRWKFLINGNRIKSILNGDHIIVLFDQNANQVNHLSLHGWTNMSLIISVSTLEFSDALWRERSWLLLVLVMVWHLFGHYLNQWWQIDHEMLNTYISTQGNVFENVFFEIAELLCWPQWVKSN